MNMIKTILFFTLASFTIEASASDLRESLFNEADDAMRAASNVKANVLSPKHYAIAADAFKSASDRFEKGQSIERIKSDLQVVVVNLQEALDKTRLAEVVLAAGIGARNDALKANADQFAKDEWKDAEKDFVQAASKLEDGNVKSAEKFMAKGIEHYRAAELAAIKSNLLSETRQLISTAEDNDAKKYAPETLKEANRLLAAAEDALTNNRYDADQPRAIAREAKYTAGRANYIANNAKQVAKKKQSLEQMIIQLETPLEKVYGELDISPALDGSISDVAEPLVKRIGDLQKNTMELSERRTEILGLEKEIADLEKRLGVQSERMANQELARQRLQSVERIFEDDEAMVMKQGNRVVIRLIGLSFPSGKATIESNYFALLKKVQRAINVYPEATAIVEGHTDAFGSDDTNLQLSRLRAEAVRTYLIANMSERASKIDANGYGESRPIASNETKEGRAKNRRIDLVLEVN